MLAHFFASPAQPHLSEHDAGQPGRRPSLASRYTIRYAGLALGMLATATLSFLAWQHYWPVQAADAWSVQLYRENIPMVSALLVDERGSLYISQEFTTKRGVVARLQADGSRQDIMTGLSKPDGLVLFGGGIAASQESGQQPVLWWHDGKTVPLFAGYSVEGIASDGHSLFAIEDVKRGGRLLKYDPTSKETTTLRGDLEQGEGIAVCPDGRLVYTEKMKGWIKRFVPGGEDEVIAHGLHAPSFLMCNDEGLWIAEDLTHGARLLQLDASGALQTILTRLRAPQTIIAIAPARILLAEQGRGRILEINRLADAK